MEDSAYKLLLLALLAAIGALIWWCGSSGEAREVLDGLELFTDVAAVGPMGIMPVAVPTGGLHIEPLVGDVNRPTITRAGMEAKFSNLVQANMRNNLTSENWWRYYFKYPLIPSKNVGPVGANWGSAGGMAGSPHLETVIVEGSRKPKDKDPLPQNYYFALD
jgi:hypothetical protein